MGLLERVEAELAADAAVHDPETYTLHGQVDRCDDCGEPVPIGGWPFCASPANPAGHAKGAAYDFKMRFGMKAQGWGRRER